MKKYLILLFTALSLVTTQAQKIGGFGSISLGGTYITSSQMQARLQGETLFGNGFSFKQPGTHIGLRLLGAFDNLLIGGSGYANTFIGNSDIGEVNLKVVGRFLNVGYFIISKPKTHMYTFFGIGGESNRLIATIIEQGVGREVSFGPNQKVSHLSPEVLQKSIGFEIGLGLQKFIDKSEDNDGVKSGFLIGLVTGINLFPSTKWEFKPNETNVANMGNMSTFYIGITIGGGGFSNE